MGTPVQAFEFATVGGVVGMNLILASARHPENALAPMLCTNDGIIISWSDWQSFAIDAGMLVKEFDNPRYNNE